MKGPEWHNIVCFPENGEVTPFLYGGKEYLLRNCSALNDPEFKGKSDFAQIVDVENNTVTKEFFHGHYFNSLFCHNGVYHCFGALMGDSNGWKAHSIEHCFSTDLVNWSEPVCIYESENCLFNTAVTFDGRRFVMVTESDDPRYPKFTFNFLESEDLKNWREIPGAIYGDKKYVGGPSIYYLPDDGYFYLTYVNRFTNPVTSAANYNTCIARSRDLINYEEGIRPVINPDYDHRPQPETHPDVYDINASDAEFLEINGRVKCYCSGGNKNGVGDLKCGEFYGTLAELFQRFFEIRN